MDEGGGMFTGELPAATGNTAGDATKSPHTELHGYDNLQHFPADPTDQTPFVTTMAELPVLEIFPPDPSLWVEMDSGLLPISPSWLTSPMPLPEVTPGLLRTINGLEDEECPKGHADNIGIEPRGKVIAPIRCRAGEPDRPRRKARAAKGHNEAEKKRRARIKTKMKELRELLPISSKLDAGSTLDEAIKHLKSLQFQIQALGMGCWACATPMAAPLFSYQWMQHPHQMGSIALGINEGMQPEPVMASSWAPLGRSISIKGAPALLSLHQPSQISQIAATEWPQGSTSWNPI